MKALKIISPGPFTTVQDRGRFGLQQFGVPPCGMLDRHAGDIANLLVGNDPDAAVLEFTFMGGQMEALDTFCLAVTGADMGMTINSTPCAAWSTHRVTPGDRIHLGGAATGCRTYLAVSGGIDVPLVMGSRSTYTGARIGGMDGGILKAGDILARGKGRLSDIPEAIPEDLIPAYPSEIVLRAIPGPQDNFFDLDTFFNVPFTVTDKANRMGYRLQGEAVTRKPGMPKSIISEPSLPGGVQVPEDGQPIILLAEQTVGGYAKAATVISSDIPRLAQAVPGNRIRFESVSLETAHEIYMQQTNAFEKLKKMDLQAKTWAAMGKAFFDDPVFCQRIEKYMLQV
ncbi:MAG TPA: KipI antagonist [Desulfobacteraceae bacterium]|nr:KipI antagonist [Desulfobacteraceae bacterium]